MDLLGRLGRRIWYFLNRRRLELELEQEMAAHRAEMGEPLGFGNTLRLHEESADVWGWTWFDDLRGDLRYAARALRRTPGFTVTAIMTIALGIGANTAIFNLVETVLLRSLPVNRPDDLVALASQNAGADINYRFSYKTYEALQRSSALEGVIASASIPMNVESGGAAPDPTTTGQLVSGNYYELLGVNAALGRTIATGDDEAPGAAAVVVLSHGYWQRRFGGDPSVLGRSVRLNGYPFTIVGVSAPGFFGTRVGAIADVTVPVSMQTEVMPTLGASLISGPGSNEFWLELIGRMKPEVGETHALAELQPMFQRQMDEARALLGAKAASLGHPVLAFHDGHAGVSAMRQRIARPLQILMGFVVMVLLVACGNVANLLLARTAARRREMAVRASLGASRTRLVRQLVTECLVISFTGGAVGMLLTWLMSDVSADWLASRANEELTARPTWTVFAFAFGLSIVTGLIFGVLPTWRALRVNPQNDLKDGDARNVAGDRRVGRGSPLVVAQVALSLVLLVGAGLFVRSLINLQNVALGFDAEHVLTLRLEPRGSNQKALNQGRLMQLYSTLIERVQALPGVRAASVAGSTPIASENIGFLTHLPGEPAGVPVFVSSAVAGIGADLSVAMMQIYPGYFATLGIPFLAGRDLNASDNALPARAAATHREPVNVVVNNVMADRFLEGGVAIGRTFLVNPGSLSFQVIGIVADARERDVRRAASPTMYVPYAGAPTGRGQMTLVVRTTDDPSALAGTIRELARGSDESMPLFDVETVTDKVRAGTAQERMLAMASSVFGILALAVAAIGLYGVMWYTVARRTRDIGIRIALGAARSYVLWTTLRSSLVLVGAGVAIGLAVAFAATRLIESQLFGLQSTDPVTIVVAVLTTAMLGTIAGYVPARRAAGVDPMIALRHD